jgi:putative FmdB family regulatory protein
MPIYEYKCQKCGHHHEALQKLSDEPLTQCPKCQELALKKLISAAGFRLKGGGWYETDFKSGNKKNLHQSGSSDSGGGEKKSGAEKTGGEAGSKDTKSSSSDSKSSNSD